MRRIHLPFLLVFLVAIPMSGQDSKPSDFALFDNVKETVERNIMHGIYVGWDFKLLPRSGDLVAITIAKTIPESDLLSPPKTKLVLDLLHNSFDCLRCIESPGNRQPNVTMLLLEHLRNHASATLQLDIDKARQFIVQQTYSVQ